MARTELDQREIRMHVSGLSIIYADGAEPDLKSFSKT
jgi:hypothetical protein